ncbi:MAG: biotin--[acetyl-CoA-carboxylase] ligase [Chloroflexota bacterium]
MLSETLLNQHLSQPFRYFESVDSTNNIAQSWLRDGADVLSVVIADEQRKGRGRRGRIWYTPPNVALAVSVILKPTTQVAPRISMVGALAVYDTCQYLNINEVGIKWPNDVQIAGKKVSGILPEAVWQDDHLLGVALGMGVNVRNQLDGDLSDTATTLSLETSQPLNRAKLIAYLLERVAYWYSLVQKDDLVLAWKARLNTIGQTVTITGDNINIVGQAVDIDPDGALLIEKMDGSIQRVLAGDVSLRPAQ